MIIASVRFPLPPGTTLESARRMFEENVALYRTAPGLVRKDYVVGTDRGGGVYLWTSRAAAEAFYTPHWRAMITAKYGGAPEIEWLEVPLTVNNGPAD